MIPGLEGIHTWNGGALVLNDRDNSPVFIVEKITGFGLGDADDNRDVRNGSRGEVARRGQRRGRTVSYEGTLRASSLLALRQAEDAFYSAFEEMSEKRMDAALHPSRTFATGSSDYSRFFYATPLSPVIVEAQESDFYERAFAVTMRLSDPRVFWPSQVGPSSTGAFSATGQRTNYAQNPSLELNGTGWGIVGTTAFGVNGAYADSTAPQGDYTFVVWTTGASNPEGIVYAIPGSSPLPASTQYTASLWVKASAAGASIGKTFRLRLEERTSAGAVVGESFTAVTLDGTWQRVSVTRTFGSTGVDAQVYITSTTTHAVLISADGLLIEAASSMGTYFDGDDPDADWTGTAHGSTSKTRVSQTVAVTNPGSTDADPILTIHGPTGLGWAIDNQTLGKRLAWEGYALSASEIVVVDFRNRTALMGGVDVSEYLDFSLTDWWDEGTPGLAKGANTLALWVSAFDSNTDLAVSFYPADAA